MSRMSSVIATAMTASENDSTLALFITSDIDASVLDVLLRPSTEFTTMYPRRHCPSAERLWRPTGQGATHPWE